MSSEFVVFATSRFERELKKLAAGHPDLVTLYRQAIGVLKTDPYNRSRQADIKKLTAVPAGDGQYRMRAGRFRLRYEIRVGPCI